MTRADADRRAIVVWLTGMSGAGKSTLAEFVVRQLVEKEFKAAIIDGDAIRNTIHRHLGFSREHIGENNTLISSLCQDRRTQYDVILVPVIAPIEEHRAKSRQMLEPDYYLVHVYAAISTLEARDTKGLYKMARAGEIQNLIGMSESAPYEVPKDADLRLDTGEKALPACEKQLLTFIMNKLKHRSL